MVTLQGNRRMQEERGDGKMKGNEITRQDMERWKKEGFFPVSCRLCGKVMLFSKMSYRPKEFVGWECGGALSPQCKQR